MKATVFNLALCSPDIQSINTNENKNPVSAICGVHIILNIVKRE